MIMFVIKEKKLSIVYRQFFYPSYIDKPASGLRFSFLFNVPTNL